MKTHLLIPDLQTNWTEGRGSLAAYPNLQTILRKGDHRPASVGYANTLFSLLGLPISEQVSLPLAQAYWQADTDQSIPEGLMLAAPVNLRADMEKIRLFDAGSISKNEVVQFAAMFNQHFADRHLTLHPLSAQRWYISGGKTASLVTHPLETVVGNSIQSGLPSGEDAVWWMQIFTELQMLWFDISLNQHRQQQGALPVNGLWFYGNGALAKTVALEIDSIVADDVLATSLAAHYELPLTATGDRQLQVMTEIQHARAINDQQSWQQAMQRLEQQLGKLIAKNFVLYPCNGTAIHWTKSMKYRFWRKK